MAQESKNENRKQRIREAFHDGKQVERMPAREDMAPQHSDDVIYRVAPYCRVSTMSEMQAESFEIQQQYYNEYIAKHPNWTLVRIYADEGISATSVKNRKDFNNRLRIVRPARSTSSSQSLSAVLPVMSWTASSTPVT